MKNTATIISGGTGFLGGRLTRFINDKLCFKISYSDKSDEIILLDSKNIPVNLKALEDFEVKLVHLATFYSKNEEDNKKIKKANIDFGEKLIENFHYLNVKKIIYTNTMFVFYKSDEIRNLYYTQTKNKFSKFLNDYSSSNNIEYEEIFLDNTYGKSDQRNKIIPNIVNSINNKQPNPIKFKNNFINLMHVDDVIKRLTIAIEENLGGRSRFTNHLDAEIGSIYDFLFFHKYKSNKKEIIFKNSNEYLDSKPILDHKNIKLKNLNEELINMIKI